MAELFNYLFTFEGRINRARIWLALLFCIVIGMFLDVLTPLMGRVLGEVARSFIFGFINLVLFASFISLQARRLHDRDKSAWWLLLQCIPFVIWLPLLYLIIQETEPADYAALETLASFMPWVSIPIGALILWFFIQIFCLRGTIGPNRFGPDPLAAVSGETSQMRTAGD